MPHLVNMLKKGHQMSKNSRLAQKHPFQQFLQSTFQKVAIYQRISISQISDNQTVLIHRCQGFTIWVALACYRLIAGAVAISFSAFSVNLYRYLSNVVLQFLRIIQMQIFLFSCLVLLSSPFIIPVPTGSERCMVIYSVNQEDTIKLTVKFPKDHSIEQFYDFIAEIRDLQGQVISSNTVHNQIFKTQIIVPKETIYEACIKIAPNQTKHAHASQRYQGEILIDYEANTHFMTESSDTPFSGDFIKEEEIAALKSQANHVINATQEYIRLQTLKKESEDQQFLQRREIEDSLFEWWMLQLSLIIVMGAYQWNKMKKKIQSSGY